MAIRDKKKFVSASEPSRTWSSVAEFKTAMNITDDGPFKNVASKQSKANEWFLEDGVVHAYVFYANIDDRNAAQTPYKNAVASAGDKRKYIMYHLASEEV